MIGSGFAESLNLTKIIGNRLNYGNSIETNKIIKSKEFFVMMQKQKILHPNWSFKINKNWLIKYFDSFGGEKVFNSSKSKILKRKNRYFQELILGDHISVQFFVNKDQITILCYCKQHFNHNCKRPFLIKALTTLNLSDKIKKKVDIILKKVSSFYKLNGLNNLDLVVENNENVYLIEINPRPGLSINIISRLYTSNGFSSKDKKIPGFGTMIIYSNKKITNNKKTYEFFYEISKSSNYSELPTKDEIIKKNNPICLSHFTFSENENLEEKIKKISYKFHKELSNHENKY